MRVMVQMEMGGVWHGPFVSEDEAVAHAQRMAALYPRPPHAFRIGERTTTGEVANIREMSFALTPPAET